MSLTGISHSCPLCGAVSVEYYFQDKKRLYLQCGQCDLVFVDKSNQLSAEQEKSEYDLHQNIPDDPGYRKFLSRLYLPMLERLQKGAEGLDFGCGPGPTLPIMLTEAGFNMSQYDPYYFKDPSVLNRCYDFITATEVVEHLYEPGKVFRELWSMLPTGGCLGLMTKLLEDVNAFSNWHYKNDPSHVCFYSRVCFKNIATMLNADLSIMGKDVIILSKR